MRILRNISGPRIRTARLRQRPSMSQARLAQLVNKRGFRLDASMLCRIENQERGVLDTELQAFARCLKTSIAWLCGELAARR